MNICRTSLRRALAPSPLRAVLRATSATPSSSFSTSSAWHNATPALTPDAASPAAAAASDAAAADAASKSVSSCPEGTVLSGLNYIRGKSDPVAMRDEDYPDWLWKCLDVMKTVDTGADADAGDEFSKSKKQRRLARKRQREIEDSIRASGDLTALAPKIPLQHQTLNLVGGDTVTTDVDATLAAAEKRTELRVAMRKERRAKIKEDNYLRTM